MGTMKRKIAVTREDRAFLMKAFGVSEVMVSYALNYDAQNGMSKTAEKIRTVALQRGGIAMVLAPASEVVHMSDNVMRQYYADGSQWECDRVTDVMEVKDRHGEVVERIEHPKVSDVMRVQSMLETRCQQRAV
jgi:hypothetical protein